MRSVVPILSDGQTEKDIKANLRQGVDTGTAAQLAANSDVAFIGVAQKAPFEMVEPASIEMLYKPNPHGRPNSDVLRLMCNATDITQRPRWIWNVDYGVPR